MYSLIGPYTHTILTLTCRGREGVSKCEGGHKQYRYYYCLNSLQRQLVSRYEAVSENRGERKRRREDPLWLQAALLVVLQYYL